MFYLIDPIVAATAIGARCGSAPDPADEGLLNILSLLTPRVEDAMNVASLVYGETTDAFSLNRLLVNSRTASNAPVELRLANGYLDAAVPVVVTGPDGVEVDPTTYKVDRRYGMVSLTKFDIGEYSVVYTAGFHPVPVDPENPDAPRVLQNTPDWIKGLVVTMLILWYRTMVMAPKAPQGFRFDAIIQPILRDLAQRVVGRYNRPRQLVEFDEGALVE